MKIRIADRVLVALAGLLLIALCAATVAETFFQVRIMDTLAAFMKDNDSLYRILLIAALVLVLVIGVYCFLLLFRHRSPRDGFVMQKTENGELAISMKALQDLVAKCTDKHDELQVESCELSNSRDGLQVDLKVKMAGGVSIPMTVASLQKQISQYVTACSGVEVADIMVRVETGEGVMKDSPFAVADPTPIALLKPMPGQNISEPDQPALPENGQKPAEEPASAPTPVPAPRPASVDVPEPEGESEFDDRPMHQRIFRPEEEAQIVPMPPKPEELETVPEPQEATVTAETAATEESAEAAPETAEEAAAPADFASAAAAFENAMYRTAAESAIRMEENEENDEGGNQE